MNTKRGFQPGDTVQLQIAGKEHVPRIPVRVLGQLPGISVIVTHPSREGRLISLREGERVIGRLFDGGRMIGFESRVLKLSSSPIPYLHLHYPRRLQQVRIRRSPRVAVTIPCRLRATDGREADGEIRDISVDGCLMESVALDMVAGDSLTVVARLRLDAGAEHGVSLAGVLRNVSEGSEGRGSRFGVQFRSLTPGDALTLRAFMYERMQGEDPAVDAAAA